MSPTHEQRPSRRAVLAAAGSLAFGTAGCISGPDDARQYRLSAETVPGALHERLAWEPPAPRPRPRERMDRLVETGSLSTLGGSLIAAEPPRYVERAGTYYRIDVAEPVRVERERWVLWFDLIDGTPSADATVFTSSLGTGDPTDLRAAYGLSERDVRAVEDAAGEVPTEFGYRDVASEPPGQRGHVFLRRGPDGTDLLPTPPFTHVAFEGGDGTRYARAVTEQATVEVRRYDHTATAVADSAAAYRSHVRDRHLAASFARDDLPRQQREILDRVTRGGGRYAEQPPLSDPFTAVLERLGLADVDPGPDGTAFSDPAYFRYRSGTYAGELSVV